MKQEQKKQLFYALFNAIRKNDTYKLDNMLLKNSQPFFENDQVQTPVFIAAFNELMSEYDIVSVQTCKQSLQYAIDKVKMSLDTIEQVDARIYRLANTLMYYLTISDESFGIRYSKQITQ